MDIRKYRQRQRKKNRTRTKMLRKKSQQFFMTIMICKKITKITAKTK